MKIISEQIKEEIVGKDEAGRSEFKDTGIAIETGDKAFVVRNEDSFSGHTSKLYFSKRENAEQYL